ncbi:MAG: hypothetical protein JJ902_05240 [Roseibium sp.]|nr:hypothetical protein [Roseibium sp.]
MKLGYWAPYQWQQEISVPPIQYWALLCELASCTLEDLYQACLKVVNARIAKKNGQRTGE